MAHRRDWASVRRDCEKALDIDRESVKANYMLGLSLIYEKQYGDAAKRLEKALEYARASQATIQDEIWRELARAKYLEWEVLSKERKQRYDALEAKLMLLAGGVAAGGSGAAAPHAGSGSQPIEIDMDTGEVVAEDASKPLAGEWGSLREMLDAVREQDNREEEPPDAFCCKLTFEVFRDPMVGPSGHSYERLSIMEHLKKVGLFDPITREVGRATGGD